MTKNLEKSFYYILLLLPIIYVLGSGAINVAIVFLNIIFLLHIFSLKKYFFFKKNRLYLYLVLLYVLYQITNNILNENYENFFKSIVYIRFLFLPLIFHYFFSLIEIEYNKISKFYLFVVIILIVDLLFQFIFEFNFLGFKPGLYNDDLNIYERYAGIFNQELVMGGYLATIGFFSIIFYTSFGEKKKYLFYIFLLLLFISIFITGERSSTLSYLLSIFFIFYFCKEYRKNILYMIILIVLTYIVSIKSSEQLRLRYFEYPLRALDLRKTICSTFGELLSAKYSTRDCERISIEEEYANTFKLNELITTFMDSTHWGYHYQAAYKMFQEKPLIGYGFKQFRIKCRDYKILYQEHKVEILPDGCSTHPHNYVLEILSEQGIIGLIIIYLIIYTSLRNSYKKNENKTYWFLVAAIIFGYIFPFKPTGAIFSTWYSSFFWFMLGFSFFQKKKNK